MSVLQVVAKDFKDARRTRTLWYLLGVLGGIAGLQSYSIDPGRATASIPVQQSLFVTAFVGSVLLPIATLVLTYLAIVGERESGSIKFLLSLPNSRRDVFVGKFVSRMLVVGLGVGAMYLVSVAVSVTRFGSFPAAAIAGIVGVSVLYAATFVSLGVALSASVASRSRAIAGSVGLYFVLIVMYVFPPVRISGMVRYLHTDLLGMGTNPDLYDFVEYTSPFRAFQKALNLVVPPELELRPFSGGAGPTPVSPDLPVYLSDEFSLAIFAFWVAVPLAVGYWRFERADIS